MTLAANQKEAFYRAARDKYGWKKEALVGAGGANRWLTSRVWNRAVVMFGSPAAAAAVHCGGSKWTHHRSLLFISRNKMCPLTSHISARPIAGEVECGTRTSGERINNTSSGVSPKVTLEKGTQQMAYKLCHFIFLHTNLNIGPRPPTPRHFETMNYTSGWTRIYRGAISDVMLSPPWMNTPHINLNTAWESTENHIYILHLHIRDKVVKMFQQHFSQIYGLVTKAPIIKTVLSELNQPQQPIMLFSQTRQTKINCRK